MRVRVVHGIDRLEDRLREIPVQFAVLGAYAVRAKAHHGNNIAQGFARTEAGPHGMHYWKRLSMEMTGPMEAEYGPTGIPKSEFVGVAFRHRGRYGRRNMDLPRSADIILPELAREVRKFLPRLSVDR